MEQKIDSWGVEVNKENRARIIGFMEDDSYLFDTGAFYGINKKGVKAGSIVSSSFDKIISTEEFYQKIGIGNNILLKLEIY